MPEHLWSVCCERAIIDQRNNKVSLIDVVEVLMVPEEAEIVPMQIVLASYWVRRKEETGDVDFECRFTWRDPSGEALEERKTPVNISGDNTGSRAIFTMLGFRVKGKGRHCFRIEQRVAGSDEFELVKEIPIEVRRVQQALNSD